MNEWSQWNACTKSCGKGSKSRIRSILVEPAFEGKECGSTIDTTECNTNSCPGKYISVC